MMADGRPATVLEEARHAAGADSTAAILAIGTANPANCVPQNEFADWYFRVTKSDHLAMLKAKMKRICEKSGVKKRHFHHTEETIAAHPEFLDLSQPSLGARLGIAADAVPELAAAAAARAIAEWGRPAADVTHLVVSTNAGAGAPGADLRLAEILGLRPAVRRTMLYLHGCSGGSVALRLAKDLAENNHGARVLVVCAEVILLAFREPDEAHLDALVANALFGDGAGAAIVGADPASPIERPIFRMVSAAQVTLPGTGHAVGLQLRDGGLDFRMSVELPAVVRGSIEGCLADALAPLGVASGGWNGLFWAAHPGGRAILDSYEAALGLEAGKLAASRRVLSEYGNMLGATIFFVLDEMRRHRHRCRGGDGEDVEDCEWGVMLGLGPGLTIETMVLHAAGSRDED